MEDLQQQADEAEAKVLDRLRKIKQLADRGGTPEEAAAATAMMQKLMLKFAIDAEKLMQESKAPRNRFAGYGHKMYRNAVYNTDWAGPLMGALAYGHSCTVVVVDAGTKRKRNPNAVYDIMGEERLVRTVENLHRLLCELLPIMAKSRFLSEALAGNVQSSESAWLRSYLIGAVRTIFQRMQEVKSEYSTALTVYGIDKKSEEIKDKLYPFTQKMRQYRRTVNTSAYDAGRTDAKALPVSKPSHGESFPKRVE